MISRWTSALALLCAGCSAPYSDAPAWRPESLGGDRELRAETRPGEISDPAHDGVLTLEDCVRIAMSSNRRVWSADRRVLMAEDRLREDISTVLPRLTADLRYDWRSNDRGSTVGGVPVVAGKRHSGSGRLGLMVPIYDFGSSALQRDADSLRIDAAGLDAVRSRQDLELAVSQAYFRLLEARKIRTVVDDSLKLVSRQLEIARDFLSQGLVARSDVLTAEVQLAERRQDQIRAAGNEDLAAAALNRLLGFEIDRQPAIVDLFEAEPWKGSFDSVLHAAVERRPDLMSLRKQVETAQAQYESVSRARFPSLYAAGGLNYSTDRTLLNRDWFDASVVLQIPLFDGFNTKFRMDRTGREIAEAIDVHDDRVDDIVLQVRQTWLMVREASERVPVARKSIEQAEENLRVVRDQYAAGVLTSADVLAEEDRLSRTRTGYFRALYDYHAAKAGLVHAVAGPLPEP